MLNIRLPDIRPHQYLVQPYLKPGFLPKVVNYCFRKNQNVNMIILFEICLKKTLKGGGIKLTPSPQEYGYKSAKKVKIENIVVPLSPLVTRKKNKYIQIKTQ